MVSKEAGMKKAVRVTEAQLTALQCAGIFEAPEGDEVLVVEALRGRVLDLAAGPARIAAVINDLSNAADERLRDEADAERAAWARSDARALANLYSKILKEA